jgi:hypothetical protein
MDLTSQDAAEHRKLQALNRAHIDQKATTFKIREDYTALFRIISS